MTRNFAAECIKQNTKYRISSKMLSSTTHIKLGQKPLIFLPVLAKKKPLCAGIICYSHMDIGLFLHKMQKYVKQSEISITPSSHLCRQDPCSLLTPGLVQAGDQDSPGPGVLSPASLPISHLLGWGVGQPTVSLHKVYTVQVCCLLPVFPSVTHRAVGSGRPQCHCTLCRLCRRAASGPSSLPSLTAVGSGSPQVL